MSNVIASQRSFVLSTQRQSQPQHAVPNTKFLDLEYDSTTRSLWTFLTERAPAFASLDLIHDRLSVDTVYTTSAARDLNPGMPIDFRVMASKRTGVFSLGGDLASFRYCIDRQDRAALTRYAHAAIDAIWNNTQGCGMENLTSVALVQGEAQGGGFECALSAHVLVAEKGAMFGFPEALFGMFPGMGGSALIAARTDEECARRLIGSTKRYPAETLYEMGVIDVLAEKGRGEQTLREWLADATPASTLEYRQRFTDLERELLSGPVEEWVDRAMCLNQRQLRTMGYILEAQKRASEKRSSSNVTLLRRSVEFDDLVTQPVVENQANATPSPLLIAPKRAERANEGEYLSFVRKSVPWINRNLSKHGALLLRGFPNSGAISLSKLSAALRADRVFDAKRSVPTPSQLDDNVFQDDCWLTTTPQALFNAYSDGPLYPSFKILACDQRAPAPSGSVTLASTKAIYQQLGTDLLDEFETRGVSYYRRYPDAATLTAESKDGCSQIHSWQHIFKTSERDNVERKCRDNGLHFQWSTDGGIEVWNSTPAILEHELTGDKLWFNQIHLYRAASENFIQRTSLFSKLFNVVRSPLNMGVTFGDGGAIPQAYFDEIVRAHQNVTVNVSIELGDYLIIDNILCAQGRDALHKNQRLLMTTY